MTVLPQTPVRCAVIRMGGYATAHEERGTEGMKISRLSYVVLVSTLAIASTLHAQEKEPAKSAPTLAFDGKVVLSSLVSLVDGRLSAISDLLSVAALTEEVRSGDWARMKPLLAEIQKCEGGAVAWYALPDGSYYTVDKDKMDQNLKDRPYLPKALAGQKVIGDLVVSKSTGQMSAVMVVPVSNGKTVTGILGLSLFMQKFGEGIQKDMNLPDSAIFFALNRDRVTAFHVRAERVFVDPATQGSESMTRAVQDMLAKEEGVVEYEFGGPRRVMFRHSNVTGWWYALGLPVVP